METNKAKFWIGMGLGVLVGSAMVCLSRTEKAKEWKKKACCAVDDMLNRAGDAMAKAKDKALETGDKVADRVANMAHNAADKADDMKGRVHNATDALKR